MVREEGTLICRGGTCLTLWPQGWALIQGEGTNLGKGAYIRVWVLILRNIQFVTLRIAPTSSVVLKSFLSIN